MQGHKIHMAQQVLGLDLFLSETQVRDGDPARLLGVVLEVALGIHIGVVSDDLDGILIGSDRSI